ncbi:calponin [Populus alba x Populus x berolinensis]|nr:calponin [Populus alba x Populus x berolinensis]
MAKQQQQQQPSPPSPWTTLEELLLACAVNRHGSDSWDSIAMEVSNRTSTFSSLTSQNCIDKFNDLKQRFGFTSLRNNTASSLVDELRKLRVDELRREVHRRDASIVSLEMKVKRLEDDRERSLKEMEKSSDLAKPSPEIVAGMSDGGESGDGDERSFNESNSTSQQPQKAEAETEKEQNANTELKPEPDVIREDPDPSRLGSDPEPEREWSHNGKLEDDDDKKPKKEMKIERLSRESGLGPDSNELGESVGESKREDKEKDNIKQINNNINNNNNSSDVQSSVSLTMRKKKRRRSSEEGSSSGEEGREGGDDEVSPARKKVPAVKSEPWLKLLGIIRSHRLGSVFEKRLRSQESERYRKLVRQHMDLQMIQSRVNKGVYSNCFQKFFKDLLILLNNAIVFFRKNSPENLAANELRAVVLKEVKEKLRKPKPQPVDAKPATEQHSAALSKPNKSSSTLVPCSKHSSMKAISGGAGKKGDKEMEGKHKVNEKKVEVSIDRIEDKGLKKKTTKERSVSGRRNSKTSNKNGEIKHQYGGNELSSHDALEIKVDRKVHTGRKKQGAASFLKRMKQNSPSRVTEEDSSSSSSENESKDGRKDDKKRRGREADGIAKRVTRSSRGRGSGEDIRNIKRGRPPKKQMESGSGTVKRGRDNEDSEVGVGGGGRVKKRSRR